MTNFPGVTGEISGDRCPMYGVVQIGKGYQVTVQMRVRTPDGTTKPEGGLYEQTALPETYKSQRQADKVMEALNMRVWSEICAPALGIQ